MVVGRSIVPHLCGADQVQRHTTMFGGPLILSMAMRKSPCVARTACLAAELRVARSSACLAARRRTSARYCPMSMLILTP